VVYTSLANSRNIIIKYLPLPYVLQTSYAARRSSRPARMHGRVIGRILPSSYLLLAVRRPKCCNIVSSRTARQISRMYFLQYEYEWISDDALAEEAGSNRHHRTFCNQGSYVLPTIGIPEAGTPRQADLAVEYVRHTACVLS
jgi:hypothetical protein